jgi:uncharacterized protein (DUF433 family)
MSEQATAAAFPAGTRVRSRDLPVKYGEVVPSQGEHGQVVVRWDGGATCWHSSTYLEVVSLPSPDPPRAPERVLAPGIVQSDDTCDGKPRMEGTRVRCDSVYGWWTAGEPMSEIQRHFSTRTLETYELAAAVAFEAGRRWEKERRKAKRKRKADADAS